MNPNGKIIRMQGETIEINCTLDEHSVHTINELNFEINQKNVIHEIIVNILCLFHRFLIGRLQQ